MSESERQRDAGAERLHGRTPLLVFLELLLVAVGGAVGTLGRYALTTGMPASQNVAVLAANVSGAFVLGVVVALLAGRHERLQLLLGTGVCGGFTTYSAFAVGVEQLAAVQPWGAVGFALGTVIAGIAAVACGVWIGGLIRRARDSEYVQGSEDAAS